jgi:NAD(P)-dependent dehydrogenase (short-subunit alcohol dehydrogenase family)
MSERRVALITGGARGIGYGIAERLAAENCDLAIADLHDPAAVAGAMDALRAAGARVLYGVADVGDANARSRLLDAIRAEYGALHVLVNNAGVAPKARADLLDATEESYERVMRINLQGPHFLTQAAARWMIEQKRVDPGFRGCIVNISSVSATAASVSRGEYCLSKAGLSMATRLWAARLGEFDIPVYEIRPGVIRTDMTAAVREKYDRLIAEGLLVQSRWGLPEDVGRAVAMLVRGDLPYSTGQVILVDGGFSVRRL